jgi:hypothetical protein
MGAKVEDEVIVGLGIDEFKLTKGHRGLWRLSGHYDKPGAAEAFQKTQQDARKAQLARESRGLQHSRQSDLDGQLRPRQCR